MIFHERRLLTRPYRDIVIEQTLSRVLTLLVVRPDMIE